MLAVQRLVELRYPCKARERLQEQRGRTVASQRRGRDVEKKGAKGDGVQRCHLGRPGCSDSKSRSRQPSRSQPHNATSRKRAQADAEPRA